MFAPSSSVLLTRAVAAKVTKLEGWRYFGEFPFYDVR
jgi:hypothetical protein